MPGTQPVNLVKIEAQVVWKFGRDPDNGDWLAVCDDLNMTAIGDTIIELRECADEAIALLLTDLLEEGELDSFLRINGWKLLTPLPTGLQPGVTFDVPQDFRRTFAVGVGSRLNMRISRQQIIRRIRGERRSSAGRSLSASTTRFARRTCAGLTLSAEPTKSVLT